MNIDINVLADWKFVLEMIFAALLAMGIWLVIPPATSWGSWQAFLKDFLGKIVAVVVAALVALSGGADIYTVEAFLAIVGMGVTGQGLASFALAKAKGTEAAQPSSPGPPAK